MPTLKLSKSLDLIISAINVPLDVAGFLETLAPKGHLHNVGAVFKPLEAFSARHSIAPITEAFPMSKVNDALERLRSGKARYRIVLNADS